MGSNGAADIDCFGFMPLEQITVFRQIRLQRGIIRTGVAKGNRSGEINAGSGNRIREVSPAFFAPLAFP